MRIEPDERDAFLVVTDPIQEAAKGSPGQVEDCHHADEQPERDKIVDLYLRTEAPVENGFSVHPVGRHTALSAEESRKHEGTRINHLPDSQGNHGKGDTGNSRNHITYQGCKGQ